MTKSDVGFRDGPSGCIRHHQDNLRLELPMSLKFGRVSPMSQEAPTLVIVGVAARPRELNPNRNQTKCGEGSHPVD